MKNPKLFFLNAIFFTMLFLNNNHILANDIKSIHDIPKNKNNFGYIYLKNGEMIETDDFYVTNQFIVVNNEYEFDKDTFNLNKVKMVKIGYGSKASNGFFLGLLLGAGLSYYFVLSDTESYKNYNNILRDCLLISGLTTGIGLLIGTATPKFHTYVNNDNIGFVPFIKIDEINNQNSLGITLKIQF